MHFQVASGLQINNVMGVTIGPGGYFLNFTEYGLQINGGHEVMMVRCVLRTIPLFSAFNKKKGCVGGAHPQESVSTIV